jgi:hypothetical protein
VSQILHSLTSLPAPQQMAALFALDVALMVVLMAAGLAVHRLLKR